MHSSATTYLHKEAKAREHSQTAVLDLLDLQLGEGVWVVSQTEGVKWSTGVQGVEVIEEAFRATVGAVGLSQTHQHNLSVGEGTCRVSESASTCFALICLMGTAQPNMC
jgi:hypothetical protein